MVRYKFPKKKGPCFGETTARMALKGSNGVVKGARGFTEQKKSIVKGMQKKSLGKNLTGRAILGSGAMVNNTCNAIRRKQLFVEKVKKIKS